MMRRRTLNSKMAGAALVVLVGCAPSTSPAPAPSPENAQRIVSLDYCADQYVLKLVSKERILAVSNDAGKAFSYMRDTAKNVRQVRPLAEDAIALKPDLIVRSYGGGPYASAFFERAGVPVVQLGYANDIEGVINVLEKVGADLGVENEAKEVVENFKTRLANVKPRAHSQNALYMTPGGVTAGPGSLVDDVFSAAGYVNFQQDPGWRPLPLERLAVERPDAVAAAFYDSQIFRQDAWSAADHPIARKLSDSEKAVTLPGAWMSCGGWFLINAIEALADGATGSVE